MIIVQARMGSQRLPGKVLRPIAGTTILELMLDRLAAAGIGPVVVATSDGNVDDPIADVLAERSELVFRGSEADVLDRMVHASHTLPPSDHVVRLTADCPLIDAAVVQATIDAHLREDADYTSNTLLRTFPDGLDVEVIRTEALLDAAATATSVSAREHVTPHLIRHPERYRLAAHLGVDDAEDERWTIDTADDMAWLDQLLTDEPAIKLAPWTDILRHVGYQRAPLPGQVVLRVARDDETPSATGISLGTGVVPLLDPAQRTWVARREDTTVGVVSVAARGGVGRLRGWAEPAALADILDGLEHRLVADQQVGVLECARRTDLPAETFAARGFAIESDVYRATRLDDFQPSHP